MAKVRGSSHAIVVADREAKKSYDITLRVQRTGASEKAMSELRDRFERELPLMFTEAEIVRVRRTARQS